jgi:hypothetical protein
VLDAHRIARNQDTDDIKSVRKTGCAMSVYPDLRGPNQLPALSPMHCGHGRPKLLPPSRLDFDKRDGVVATHNEIEIAMTATKPMRNQRPPIAPHPSRGDTFSLQSECLSLFRHAAHDNA